MAARRTNVVIRGKADGTTITTRNVRVKNDSGPTSERKPTPPRVRRLLPLSLPSLPASNGVISVLMAAHGTGQWIREAVDSILSQVLPFGWAIELCIGVDDDDDALVQLSPYLADPRVRIVDFGLNSGPYRCLTALADVSTGELLAVLDSDDISKPERLHDQLTCFLQDRHVDFVAGSYDTLRDGLIYDDCRLLPELQNLPLHSTWCMKRVLFDALGGYQPWRCGADADFWIRVVASGSKTVVLDKKLCTRRMRPGQLTETGSTTGPGSQHRKNAHASISSDLAAYRSGRPVKRLNPNLGKATAIRSKIGFPLRSVVLMPTIPSRERSAKLVLHNLLGQGASLIVLHLNGYGSVPDWADHPRVTAICNPEGEGPMVRWSFIPESDFVLGVDDDLIYPTGYVETMIRHLRYLGRGHAVSMHCTHWPSGASDMRSRVVLPFYAAGTAYTAKTYIGCGASAFWGENLRKMDLSAPNAFSRFDDVWMSSAIARSGIKLYRPPSPSEWLTGYPEQDNGLFATDSRSGFRHRQSVVDQALALGGWKLTPDHRNIEAL